MIRRDGIEQWRRDRATAPRSDHKAVRTDLAGIRQAPNFFASMGDCATVGD
jgi:hypothetical protein